MANRSSGAGSARINAAQKHEPRSGHKASAKGDAGMTGIAGAVKYLEAQGANDVKRVAVRPSTGRR